MIELQQAIFNRMKQDQGLLTLLGISLPAVESEISKRLLPTSPSRLTEDSIIHFWFPVSYSSSRNAMWETRHVQFRIWVKDNALITQQRISERLQQLFVNAEIRIENLAGYSKFFYVGEGQIPGRTNELYGWFLEIYVQHQVKNFSEGG